MWALPSAAAGKTDASQQNRVFCAYYQLNIFALSKSFAPRTWTYLSEMDGREGRRGQDCLGNDLSKGEKVLYVGSRTNTSSRHPLT